jgi:hypothetical protein
MACSRTLSLNYSIVGNPKEYCISLRDDVVFHDETPLHRCSERTQALALRALRHPHAETLASREIIPYVFAPREGSKIHQISGIENRCLARSFAVGLLYRMREYPEDAAKVIELFEDHEVPERSLLAEDQETVLRELRDVSTMDDRPERKGWLQRALYTPRIIEAFTNFVRDVSFSEYQEQMSRFLKSKTVVDARTRAPVGEELLGAASEHAVLDGRAEESFKTSASVDTLDLLDGIDRKGYDLLPFRMIQALAQKLMIKTMYVDTAARVTQHLFGGYDESDGRAINPGEFGYEPDIILSHSPMHYETQVAQGDPEDGRPEPAKPEYLRRAFLNHYFSMESARKPPGPPEAPVAPPKKPGPAGAPKKLGAPAPAAPKPKATPKTAPTLPAVAKPVPRSSDYKATLAATAAVATGIIMHFVAPTYQQPTALLLALGGAVLVKSAYDYVRSWF